MGGKQVWLREIPDLRLLGNTCAAQLRAVGPRAVCRGLSEALLEVLRAVQTVFQGDRCLWSMDVMREVEGRAGTGRRGCGCPGASGGGAALPQDLRAGPRGTVAPSAGQPATPSP